MNQAIRIWTVALTITAAPSFTWAAPEPVKAPASKTEATPATKSDAPPSKLDVDFRFLRADATKESATPKHSKNFAKLRQILKAEPSSTDVQKAALRFYKLEPERLSRMGTASRLKGLVPDFEAGLDNSLSTTYGNLRDGLYPALKDINGNLQPYKEQTAQNSNGITWHVRGTFYLDRLVFNSEELDVRSLNSLEENLVREVTTLYYARQRLIATLFLSPPEADDQVFYELLRLDEMTSTIDALTGGMFAGRAWKWEKDMSIDHGG